MRVVIDMQGAQTESRYRGIGRYTMSVVREVIKNRGRNEIFLVLNGHFPETIESIRAAFDNILPQENIRVWYAPGPVAEKQSGNDARRLFAELIREAFLASLRPDVIHLSSLFEGYEDNAVTSIGQFDQVTPISLTLYDLIPLLNPQVYLAPNRRYARYYMRKLGFARHASAYLAISESSRTEAIQYLSAKEDATFNTSAAVEGWFKPIELTNFEADRLLGHFEISRPFIMCAGGSDGRKNLPRLIWAYASLPLELRERHQLLLAGKIGDDDLGRLQTEAGKAGLKKHELRFTGYLTDGELVKLYGLCKVFVFPSWHEGFGLPALEAMACGAPVIAANTSSLPEVIGLSDALFDPHCTPAIAAAIERVLVDEKFRAGLITHGLHQAQRFSWQEAGRISIKAWEAAVLARKRAEVKPGIAKPRLMFVSPLPPERTGIADYSAELLPALAEYYDIVLVVDQANVAAEWVDKYGPMRDAQWLRANATPTDRVLYQMGNSPFHRYMIELMKDVPGTLVLHDFFMSGLLAWLEIHGGEPMAWTEALFATHGYRAVNERVLDSESAKKSFPANIKFLQHATGVIVHSDHSRALAKTWFGEKAQQDWRVIPLLRARPASMSKAKARRELRLKPDEFVVCSFGFLDSTKLNHRLLASWFGSALANDEKCRLVFVGENHGGQYGSDLLKAITDSGLRNRITITGFVSDELFKKYLVSADIAVQLRTDSRGETSAAVLDCMNYALPVIVNASGSMSELDRGAVWMLGEQFEDTELILALEKLWKDPALRNSMGEKGRDIIGRRHIPEKCASLYFDAIEEFHSQRLNSIHSLLGAIARESTFESAELGTLTDSARTENAIRQCMARSLSVRTLFLDISATVKHDLRTGIERVVRALCLALIQSPPERLRIEPVYLSTIDGEWGYVSARRYTMALLGFDNSALNDIPAEIGCGDIVIGLDVSGDALISAEQSGMFYRLRNDGVKIYWMVHDLLPIRMPNVFPPGTDEAHTRWIKAVSKFDGAICVSQTVADDLAAWQEEARIDYSNRRPFVINYSHHGADLANSAATTGLPDDAAYVLEQLASRPSILMVGTVEPRKGYLQTVEAFDRLWQSGEQVNLVIVGREGWIGLPDSERRDIPKTIKYLSNHPERGKRLFWLSGVSDEYLERIYTSCICLLAASFGEGFGLPLIEAAQHGLSLFARDIPIFREVAGDHARYFNAQDPVELADAVANWLGEYRNGATATSKGLKFLNWAQSAQNLLGCCALINQPGELDVPDGSAARIFFDHVQKTAGSSMRQFFVDAFGKDLVTDVIRNMKLRSALVAYASKRVVTGHFDLLPSDELPNGYLLSTVLRDPRERTLSLFFSQKIDLPAAGLNDEERMLKEMTLDEALAWPPFVDQIKNAQAAHFAKLLHLNPMALSEPELLVAARRGLERYHVVGVTEHADAFTKLLARYLRLENYVPLKRTNVTSDRPRFEDLDASTQARIDSLTAIDRILWEEWESEWKNASGNVRFRNLPKDNPDSISSATSPSELHNVYDVQNGWVELKEASISGQLRPGSDFISGEWVELFVSIRCLKPIPNLTIGYGIFHQSGLQIYGTNTLLLGNNLSAQPGSECTAKFAFPITVGIGAYSITLSAHSGRSHAEGCYLHVPEVVRFNVIGFLNSTYEGLVSLEPSASFFSEGSESNAPVNVQRTQDGFHLLGIRNERIRAPNGSIRATSAVTEISPRSQLALRVKIVNESDSDWRSDGINPVLISYRWVNAAGDRLDIEGIRTPLPRRICRKGEHTEGSVFIESPESAGEFFLELTLVQEGIFWFDDEGFCKDRIRVVVA